MTRSVQAHGPQDEESRESLLMRIVLAPVRFYQQWISPGLPRSCRYYPTCSAYAVQAVQVHGPLKGLVLGTWRVLRCNPFTRGGVDHVPDPGQWRYHHPHDVPRPDTATP
ncbi:membrane protein insertion efficiency factor YidD [Actinomyces respiraculi]|uniref:membrane protein insertion efficiency factor YidD n=1 Tax=Actinomyces respiraculi TaxID=2744574 RepID=UPI001422D105